MRDEPVCCSVCSACCAGVVAGVAVLTRFGVRCSAMLDADSWATVADSAGDAAAPTGLGCRFCAEGVAVCERFSGSLVSALLAAETVRARRGVCVCKCDRGEWARGLAGPRASDKTSMSSRSLASTPAAARLSSSTIEAKRDVGALGDARGERGSCAGERRAVSSLTPPLLPSGVGTAAKACCCGLPLPILLCACCAATSFSCDCSVTAS